MPKSQSVDQLSSMQLISLQQSLWLINKIHKHCQMITEMNDRIMGILDCDIYVQ